VKAGTGEGRHNGEANISPPTRARDGSPLEAGSRQ